MPEAMLRHVGASELPSVCQQGSWMTCYGIPVLKLDNPDDSMLSWSLDRTNGFYMDVYFQRKKDNVVYGVVVELDKVGFKDEAAIRTDLSESVQRELLTKSLLKHQQRTAAATKAM